jgi:ATP-binding cassette subfamily B protein
VLETLTGAARGRTTISITHRLTSVRSADRIYVLDQGRLVEEGSFDELMAADGMFRRLYDRQRDALDGRARIESDPVEALARAPIFAGLGEEDLAEIASAMAVREVAAGNDVVRQGEEADAMFVILDGMAEVLVASGGRERPVTRLGGGNVFGEIALLSGGVRSATVRALTPMTLAMLTQDTFAGLLGRNPDLQAEFQRLTDARLAELAAIAEEG